MIHRIPAAAALVMGLAAASCGPGKLPPPFDPVDIDPPAVLGFSQEGRRTLRIDFDEDVLVDPGDAAILDSGGAPIAVASCAVEGKALFLSTESDQDPGADYRVECRARDAWGNSARFALPFTGLNDRLPVLRINEVRTDSSKPKTDIVELYAVSGGLCAGMVLASGVIGDAEWIYRLPSAEVSAGEYLVIHLARPEEPGWEDETGTDRAASGGPDAFPEGRDFWYPGSATLVKGSGALALYGSPSSPIMDAFLYTDRTSSSDEDYGGFGSAKLKRRVEAVIASGAWRAEGGARPEACVSSMGTTETRTICRGSASADSDSRADWHIVPTKGSSFGRANSDERYEPAAAAKAASAKAARR